jgi:N6-L-threonylcarbamoyladenine synthase
VETAKTLSVLWDKPLIPVNHLVAHIYANWFSYPPPTFPLIALVVSGGHTDLVILKSHTKIKRLGGTRDDAAGEAFDKCARLLSLGYPGGPAISKAAEKFHSKNKKKKLDLFPRPMINEKNFDFSFSGLKTAVLNYTKSSSTKDDTNHIAAEIQEAIVDSLIEKSISSIKKYKPTCFLLAGGVSANKRLREKLKARIQEENMWIGLHVSSVNLCTDNAAPIASCAFFRNKKVSPFSLSPNPQFSIANPSF